MIVDFSMAISKMSQMKAWVSTEEIQQLLTNPGVSKNLNTLSYLKRTATAHLATDWRVLQLDDETPNSFLWAIKQKLLTIISVVGEKKKISSLPIIQNLREEIDKIRQWADSSEFEMELANEKLSILADRSAYLAFADINSDVTLKAAINAARLAIELQIEEHKRVIVLQDIENSEAIRALPCLHFDLRVNISLPPSTDER